MTDHKAEAERILRKQSSNDFALPADKQIALGQVHATLYLAEQQRIGNLVAYADLLPTDLSNAHPQDVADFQSIVPSIREGLGLA